jgi:hypothetical protein
MIAPRFCLVWVVLLGISGCNFRDPSVDMLEAEIRWREDQLYMLEDQLALYEAQIDSCRRENTALRKELNGEDSASPATGAGVRARPDRTPSLPDIEIPGSSDGPDVDFQTPTLPEIDFGTPVDPDDDLGDPLPGDTGAVRRTQAKPAGGSSSSADPPDTAQADATSSAAGEVVKIVLNRQLTGGKNFDEFQGDDGILVVVEPQNAAGEYVAQAAPVAVVVLDPYKSGQAAYVARWNFDTVEATALLRKSLLGRGIFLDLPWPNEPPEHSQLKLYVRYMPPDGRKLDVQQDIVVDLPARAPEGQVADTATNDDPRGDRIARKQEAAPRSEAKSGNPLRQNREAAPRPNGGQADQTPDSVDTTYPVSRDHDPNEPPPLWNAGPTESGDVEGESVLVGGGPAESGRAPRDDRIEQVLRPRPWSPRR